AASAGLCAGLAGWAAVWAGWRCCPEGLLIVGEFPIWAASFAAVLNVLLSMALTPPPAPPTAPPPARQRPPPCPEPEATTPALPEPTTVATTITTTSQAASSAFSVKAQERSPVQMPRGLGSRPAASWAALQTPVRRLDAAGFQVLGPSSQVPGVRSWLTLGLRASPGASAQARQDLAEVIGKLLAAGDATLS
ncbi:unnamed protein product, partial [Polarella glacialis]